MSLYKNLLIFRRTEETPFLIHFTNEFFRREIDFEWLWTASTKTRNAACWSLQVANMHFICIVYVQCKPPITATKCPKYWMLISSLEFQKMIKGCPYNSFKGVPGNFGRNMPSWKRVTRKKLRSNSFCTIERISPV